MDPKDQINLAKVIQEKENRKADLYSERLNTEFFPSAMLSASWRRHAYRALLKSMPLAHRLSLKDFGKAVDCEIMGDITLFQFGVLSNAIETVSVIDLNLAPAEYIAFIKEAVEHIEWYGARMKKVQDEIQMKVDKDYQMKDAVMKGNNILKPVVGEA